MIKPANVRFLDYEVELGLVLKRDITGKVTVTDANLGDFVAGLVIVNDYSARDIQIPQMQFYKGKSYRTFGPVGPYLCLLEAADIPQIKQSRLQLTVNGADSPERFDGQPGLRAGRNAHRIVGRAGLVRRRSDRHRHARGLRARLSHRRSVRSSSAFSREAKKWKVFFAEQAKRRQYLKVGDVVEATSPAPRAPSTSAYAAQPRRGGAA